MKTTVEIDDELLKAAKRVAAEEGVTLRTLIQEGLWNRVALADRNARLGEWGTPGSDITRGDIYEARIWRIMESITRAQEQARSREEAR
jgi:hypothetical protein